MKIIYLLKKKQILFFSFLFVLNSVFSFNPTENSSVTPDSTRAINCVDTLEPEVIDVFSNNKWDYRRASLGEELTLKVKHLHAFLEYAKKENKNIVLFVNDIPVKDAAFNKESKGLSFLLDNDGDVLTLWRKLLDDRGHGEFFSKKVTISVSLEGSHPIKTQVSEENKRGYELGLIDKSWFWTAIVIITALIFFFVFLATKTDMLRDTSVVLDSGRRPYSLARTQMGIWTLAIISSWLFLYVCVQHFNLLTESTIMLMGITAATGVGGLAMDSRNTNDIVGPSQGFFHDLVSNSLFRFQNLAWTIILVIVFVRSVLTYLKMPEFDDKLLLLMGISSGTYLGAKVTEKSEPTQVATENKEVSQ